MSFSEAVIYLYNARPPFHMVGGAAYKPGLENTLRLMAHVGDPHLRLRAIHVAGTNGKGSTSHLIAAALQAAGLRVGLFTSPHLVSLTERIRINGKPIAEQEVADWVTKHRAFLDELRPSFFETMTALAFDYFVREKVDIAVIETGLGGRLDSTNVLTPILSVITNIGFDHTEYLGNTLTQIAREKAGIIKPGVPCVIGETHPQTMNVFLERARECNIIGDGPETTNCRIWFADQCGYLRRCRLRDVPDCELKGNYQEQNMQTAYVALQVLKNFSPFTVHLSPFNINNGFAHVCTLTGLRGRWEIMKDKPLTICDTGHNSHGLQYVTRQLKELTNPRIWIVFGMVNDKDTDVVMQLLPRNQEYHYIFTTPNTQRARTAQEMLEMWKLGFRSHESGTGCQPSAISMDRPEEAFQYACEHASENDAIFIGGSNYLVGDAIKFFDLQKK